MPANNLFAHPAMTPIDPTDMLAWLAREGVVLQSLGEQVYLCVRGLRSRDRRRGEPVSGVAAVPRPLRRQAPLRETRGRALSRPAALRHCDPDVLTDFDTLENIADSSLDFLVACHVIEHTRNPIGSIAAALRKLKPGGRLVLVVPDKERTFDRARPVTTLEHLVEDHRDPRRDRDIAHYEEFYRLAEPVSQNHLADTIRQKFAECYAIHFHVWTHPSFAQMLNHVVCEVCPWSHVWTLPPVAERPLRHLE